MSEQLLVPKGPNCSPCFCCTQMFIPECREQKEDCGHWADPIMQLSSCNSPVNSNTLYSCSSPCLCRAQVCWQPQRRCPEKVPCQMAKRAATLICSPSPPSLTVFTPLSTPAPSWWWYMVTGSDHAKGSWGEKPSLQPWTAQPCLDFYWAIQKHACLHRVIAFCCGCYKIH